MFMRPAGGFAPAPAPLRGRSVGGLDMSIGDAAPIPHGRVLGPGKRQTRRAAGVASAYPRMVLRQSATALAIDTVGRGLFEITRPVAAWIAELGAQSGLVTLFI